MPSLRFVLKSAFYTHSVVGSPQTADRRPQTADRRPQTADHRLPTRPFSIYSAERGLVLVLVLVFKESTQHAAKLQLSVGTKSRTHFVKTCLRGFLMPLTLTSNFK